MTGSRCDDEIDVMIYRELEIGAYYYRDESDVYVQRNKCADGGDVEHWACEENAVNYVQKAYEEAQEWSDKYIDGGEAGTTGLADEQQDDRLASFTRYIQYLSSEIWPEDESENWLEQGGDEAEDWDEEEDDRSELDQARYEAALQNWRQQRTEDINTWFRGEVARLLSRLQRINVNIRTEAQREIDAIDKAYEQLCIFCNNERRRMEDGETSTMMSEQDIEERMHDFHPPRINFS